MNIKHFLKGKRVETKLNRNSINRCVGIINGVVVYIVIVKKNLLNDFGLN